MDPFTQGAMGAIAAGSVAKDNKKEVWISLILGWGAGMLADLDSLIQSSSDPLLYLEYHRQFSHSLIFVPVGAMLAALVAYAFLKKKLSFARIYLFCFLGYATHGLLDFTTSWGVALLWPFSNEKMSLHIMSIIDPLLTMILVIGIVLWVVRRNNAWARIALGFSFLYFAFSSYQQNKALEIAKGVHERRGQEPIRVLAKPTIFNTVLWKVVFEEEDRIGADGIKIVPFRRPIVYNGESTEKLDMTIQFPEVKRGTQHWRDMERFQKFSNGWATQSPGNDRVIGDLRFSNLPDRNAPLWGIQMSWTPAPEEHVKFVTLREADEHTRNTFFKMLFKD